MSQTRSQRIMEQTKEAKKPFTVKKENRQPFTCGRLFYHTLIYGVSLGRSIVI